MLIHLIEIIEGYCIWLFNIVSGKTRRTAKYRMDICNKCDNNKNGICKQCGCILKAKTRVWYPEDEHGISIGGCPSRKW